MTKKIKSVTELAKYQIGDIAYYVAITPQVSMPDLREEDCWMIGYHPKTMYSRYNIWPYHSKPPKLFHCDFETIADLLTSKLTTEAFEVKKVHRSQHTGDFIYTDEVGRWMSEDDLFDTDIVADLERHRIYKMISRWAGANING